MTLRALSLLALVVLVAAVWYLYFDHALFAPGPIGKAIQIASLALVLWARLTFGLRSFHAAANPTAGGIVMRGPYRFIRHPIYSGLLCFIWTGAVLHASPMVLAAAVVAAAATAMRIVAEERLLVERYPEYRDYAKRVRRVVPFVF